MKDPGRTQLLFRDHAIDPDTGRITDQSGCITTVIPVRVCAGDAIAAVVPDLQFQCFFYSEETENRLIYTYSYDPEGNWTSYVREESDPHWTAQPRTFRRRGYVRLTAEYAGEAGKDFCFSDLFRLEETEKESTGDTAQGTCTGLQEIPEWMQQEAEKTAGKTEQFREADAAVYLLLTDTHYTTGGIWPDTVKSMKLVAEKIRPDGLIHLGDLTDGLLPVRYTKEIVQGIVGDLRGIAERPLICLGNHDRNYFRGNPDSMTAEESAELCMGRKETSFAEDLPEKKLRLLFLNSFDPEKKERYGFSRTELVFARRALRTLPEGYRILIFSHVPPASEIHVWSKKIRNGERLLRLIERFQRKRHAVLGYIHGHNHADQIWNGCNFPVIGIGCSKLEYFEEHKPAGSVTWYRERGGPSQELWDVLVISAKRGTLDLIRFGAGEDRHV